MKRIVLSALGISFLLFTAFKISNNGDNLVEKIVRQLAAYLRESPQEKAYLQLDKPYYLAGETVWFAGYLFDGVTHGVDSVSRVLYVELLDNTAGRIVEHGQFACRGGTTSGAMSLPDDLPDGIFTLRAYTNYMRNFSENYFFQKEIKVSQGKTAATMDFEKFTDEVADLQFFPEGGDLVNGLESRVAFKAVNKLGRGTAVEGVVVNAKGDTAAAFAATHLGMGFFSFSPKVGGKYTAKILKKDGSTAAFPLPKVAERGFVLTVDNLSNPNFIRAVVANSTPSVSATEQLTVVAQQRGQVCFIAKAAANRPMFTVKIPRSKVLDDGILQITLFDTVDEGNPDNIGKGVPRGERLVFINQNRQLNLKITADKPTYKPREKITLTLEATDTVGKPVVGDFSLAATDGRQVTASPNAENMLTYLLLSSDATPRGDAVLRGNIEEPAAYFDKNNKNAARDLDVLMMTQGWRRFVWSEILRGEFQKIQHFPELGLSLTGKVARPSGKVAKNARLTLMVKTIADRQVPILMLTTADSLGRFGFYNFTYFDTAQIFVQATKEKGGRNVDLTVDNVPPPPTVRIVKVPFNALEFDGAAYADFLKKAKEKLDFERKIKQSQDLLLGEVTVKAKRKEAEDTRRNYRKPLNSIPMDDKNCAAYSSIFDFLQFSGVAGLSITRNGFGEHVVSIRGGGNVNYLVDGITTEAASLESISPCDVEAIDILKGAEAAATLTAGGGGDGVISVLTRRGNPNYEGSKDAVDGVVVQKRMGFMPKKEFYAPHYDVPKPEHDLPDNRSTLHFQSQIHTDATGKATVIFWNSDAATSWHVVAEGRSATGRIGVAAVSF